ncbi:MAG: transcription factor S [Candidatus Bathyarchaeota archaeon]|jgi:DNA-directed RNA polymerase subunit M
MEFCPKCGMRLVSKHAKKAKKDVFYLVCPKCGYKKKTEDKPTVAPKPVKPSPQESIAIIGKKEQKLRTLPTVRIECPKCGNNTAYAWQVQTRGTDESSTQFFRCTKCNYTFREYS